MSEYKSKEDISRVLLERIGANKNCLIRAREKGLHETEQYFNNLLFEDEQIASLIEEPPSADKRTIRELNPVVMVRINNKLVRHKELEKEWLDGKVQPYDFDEWIITHKRAE